MYWELHVKGSGSSKFKKATLLNEFFNEQIDRLAKNQMQQSDLIKKQTTIIKSSVEVQQEAVKTQELQARIFQSKMDQLSKSLGHMLQDYVMALGANYIHVDGLSDPSPQEKKPET